MLEDSNSRSKLIQLIKDIGEDGWTLYTIMSSFIKEGVCSASQKELSEALGLKKTAVNTRLRKLLDHGVIQKTSEGEYQILQDICEFLPFENGEALAEDKSADTEVDVRHDSKHDEPEWNAETAMKYWSSKYQETYGALYSPGNTRKEMAQMKTLLNRYERPKLVAIFDAVLRLYTAKWQSKQFTRPTIGQMVSWLAKQAEPFAMNSLKEDKQIEPESNEIDLDEWKSKGWI